MNAASIRIGTRGSPLALAQTHAVRALLADARPALAAPDALAVVVIRTTGDQIQDRPLTEIGGKGLFSREIDEAMLAGRIDLAVHSVKDLPTWLPDGITLGAVLPREDPRDVLITAGAGKEPGPVGLDGLPDGAVVGTSSLRRQAQLLARRPDLRVIPLRGNVQTRLRRIEQGELSATLLALAGLRRLGLTGTGSPLSIAEMLPAVGQAAIGVTCRSDDDASLELLAAIGDRTAAIEVAAERAMLAELDGSCRTPIAGLARIEAQVDARIEGGTSLRIDGLVARPDGTQLLRGGRVGAAGDADAMTDADAMGRDLGTELRRRAGPGFFQP